MKPKTNISKNKTALPKAPSIKTSESPTETSVDLKPNESGGPLWRKLLAGSLGFAAFGLIILTVLSAWFSQTLTSTPRFINTLKSLPNSSALQAYASQKLSQQILDNTTTLDLEKQFLTPTQVRNQTPTQAKKLLKPKIEAAISQVISSPSFASLWTRTISSAHSQALAAAKDTSTSASINVQPELNSLVAMLHKTQLGSLVKADTLNSDAGVIKLKPDQLNNLRNAYRAIVDVMRAYMAGAALAIALMVLVANHRRKAIRNLSLATALGMGLIGGALSGLSRATFTNLDPQEQAAVQSAIGLITSGLKHLVLVIAVITLVIAVVANFWPPLGRRWKALRAK